MVAAETAAAAADWEGGWGAGTAAGCTGSNETLIVRHGICKIYVYQVKDFDNAIEADNVTNQRESPGAHDLRKFRPTPDPMCDEKGMVK